MRKVIFPLLFTLINLQVLSVNTTDQDSLKKLVFNGTEKMPEPKEGISGFIKNIRTNIKYPKSVLDGDVSGKVFLKFVVEKDGSITDIQVLKGISNCQECDEEAVRVVKQYSNKWIPASQNGEPIRCAYTIPITFRN